MNEKDRDDIHSKTAETPHLEADEVGHEQSEVNLRGILIFGVTLAVATAMVCLLMLGLYRYFERQVAEREGKEQPATLVTTDRPKGPPGPILQGAPGSKVALKDPALEYEEFLREEDAELENWGWIDQGAGTVRMPIDVAKERLLEKGLPFREQEMKASGAEAGESSGHAGQQHQPK